ncbi:MAG TPA: ABC transporter permease [Gemmatimonadaceae bacterium]|nr:ABC transporter permease [Gemmatimonadaceae bacterium]
MDALVSDIRFAFRSLAKSRTFTIVALLSLALGIGANVTVFSLVNALAFRALPFPEANRLVDLHEFSATKLCSGCGVGTSYAGFVDWRANARSFSQMGAYIERPFNISGTEAAERVGGALVSWETFPLLGAQPVLGRSFTRDDDRVGAAPVVMLGDAIFARRYGSDRRIIGQTIRVNGVPHTVIGVMPTRFRFPEFADLWVPFEPNAVGGARDQRDFGVVARLRPGVSMAMADEEMHVIAKSLAERYPEQKEWTAEATRFRVSEALPGSLYGALLGAVGFVLLIVCANLAGLLLARGARRQREIAIRLALGATRRRVVRHLLTESIILSAAGGALGLLLTSWAVDIIRSVAADRLPYYVVFDVDRATLAFALGVSILTGLLFGLLPALRASAPEVHTTLKDSGTTIKKSMARGMLVIGELALAMILLAGAGVLTRSVVRIATPERGREELDLLTGDLEFLDARYSDSLLVHGTVASILDRLQTAPGVVSASAHAFQFVAGFGRADRSIRAEGVDTSLAQSVSPRFAFVVTPGYFATERLPIRAGRGFNTQDRIGSQPVVMINQRMADVLWRGRSPLGRRIKLGTADSLPWLTVVGVVGDITSRDTVAHYAYVPFAQTSGNQRVTLLVRSSGDPLSLVATVRAAVRSVDEDLPILALQTVRQQRRSNIAPYQLYATTMGAFAAFAILLAAIGLYGVVAYNAAQRTREIGLRIALGAESKHVVALIAGQGGRLVLLGIVLGTAGSMLLLRVLRAMLFGASPIDLPVFTAVALLLVFTAALATWLPARRAARVDPLEALRAE